MPTVRRAPQPRQVFVDSSGYLVLVNSRDTHHQEMRLVWTRLTVERWAAFTANLVVAETHALFLVRLGHHHATSFLRQIAASSTTTVRSSGEDEQQARVIIYRYDDHDFSLTDALTSVVMRRLETSWALTVYRHFAE